MTERFRPLPLLAAIATLLLAVFGAMIADEPAQALKCSPGQCPPPPEELPGEELPPAPKPPTKSMLVIGVGWNTGDPASSSELEPGRNGLYVNFLRGHFNEWLAGQIAPAPFKNWEVTNGGEYTIAAPAIPPNFSPDPTDPSPRPCPNLDFVDEIWARAEAAARQNGFNPDNYAALVFQWKTFVCFSGLQEGRRISLIHPKFAAHEFGHYLGLGHAAVLRCKGADGLLVALSESCAVSSFADDYDSMGYSSGSPEVAYNAIHTNKLGWMSGQFYDVVAEESTRSFFLKPFTDPAHAQRALRLKDGSTTLWLEYRTEAGIDHESFSGHKFFPDPGLVVRRESPGGVSQLLDMTPGSQLRELQDHTLVVNDSTDFIDAPLPIGRTWANPLGEMKITLNSATAAGATVSIAPQRLPVPDFRGLTPSQAGAALEVAGLRSGGWNGTPDWFCDNIGRVVEQYPYAGTRVLPATPVSLTLGEEPPYCL
jgi:hypothetical protein